MGFCFLPLVFDSGSWWVWYLAVSFGGFGFSWVLSYEFCLVGQFLLTLGKDGFCGVPQLV